MPLTLGSLQWGSLLESLDAARLVDKLLETLMGNKLVASLDPEVVLTITARRGREGNRCLEALLSVRVSDEGLVGLEPSALASLSDRLELLGLEVAGLRGGDGFIEVILRVEQSGNCD
ncbi:hypothetical protein Pyrfu_1965 [Pyrolobus fumarii 1A]|uniref:Uncharacterized protein n=1 Tax=Pyrolobus fumarii (strain DSM 11204 / 1A) TaxID=694429 RepID=G0EDL4_PYRF1|nr:hypothetical protein [Pyrolobus fumarii]AEM39818.1 hypothetical protein Pyrfu_1965 [Pyrolobus fumarii 1A]